MKANLFSFCCVLLVFGCHHPPDSYQITSEGIFSRDNIITQFSVSQFKMDHKDLDDIRPKDHSELMRYCCDLKTDRIGDKTVLFKMNNSNYRWSLCKLDTSIIANDSLNSLSFEDKLKYLKERDKFRKDTSKVYLQLPFFIQKGYVYQIFGLPNLDGSYYFCLNLNGSLLVQFVDKGSL